MEVCVSVCVRELVVCVVVFACYVCMCLVSHAFTEPLESSERHDTHTHTHSCSCTQTYKNTQIYVDANAHTPFGHAHERVHFNSRFQRRRVNAGLIFFFINYFSPQHDGM